MPWKNPQITPTRTNKTVSAHNNINNFELNQVQPSQPSISSHRLSSQLQQQSHKSTFGNKGRPHYQ